MTLSKCLFPVFLFLFSTFNTSAQDITLGSQIGVDLFFNNSTTAVYGDLTIESISFWDPITNLSSLSNLNYVSENLTIIVPELVNMNGLNNLDSVGGNLIIRDNDAITNLNGLGALTTVGGNLIIQSHNNLSSVDGLNSLSNIRGNLRISSNRALNNLNGLNNLIVVSDTLSIGGNERLINLDGLSNVVSPLNSIYILNNERLENVDGLSDLTELTGNLFVRSNDVLTDCCGIQNLLATPGAVMNTINIAENPSACSSQAEIIDADCTTSLSSVALSAVEIFPNPVKNQLFIVADGNGFSFTLFTIDGTKIQSGFLDKNTTIDFSNMSKGVYILNINDNRASINRKIFKMN